MERPNADADDQPARQRLARIVVVGGQGERDECAADGTQENPGSDD